MYWNGFHMISPTRQASDELQKTTIILLHAKLYEGGEKHKDNKGVDKITYSKPLPSHSLEVILHELFQGSSVKAELAYINHFQDRLWFSSP